MGCFVRTLVVVALNVIEEPTEADSLAFIQTRPAQGGAHPLGRLIGAHLIVLGLHTQTHLQRIYSDKFNCNVCFLNVTSQVCID